MSTKPTKKKVSKKKLSSKTSTKKKVSKKKVTPTKGHAFKIPKGFEVMECEDNYALNHDFEAEPELIGYFVEVKTVPKTGKMKKDTRVLVLRKDDASLVSVWESAALKSYFDEFEAADYSEADRIFIRFTGWSKVKGRKTEMKNFVVATA